MTTRRAASGTLEARHMGSLLMSGELSTVGTSQTQCGTKKRDSGRPPAFWIFCRCSSLSLQRSPSTRGQDRVRWNQESFECCADSLREPPSAAALAHAGARRMRDSEPTPSSEAKQKTPMRWARRATLGVWICGVGSVGLAYVQLRCYDFHPHYVPLCLLFAGLAVSTVIAVACCFWRIGARASPDSAAVPRGGCSGSCWILGKRREHRQEELGRPLGAEHLHHAAGKGHGGHVDALRIWISNTDID